MDERIVLLETLVKEMLDNAVIAPGHGGLYGGISECRICHALGSWDHPVEHNINCWTVRAREALGQSRDYVSRLELAEAVCGLLRPSDGTGDCREAFTKWQERQLIDTLREIALTEGGEFFCDKPDRWCDEPHWRCRNGHVSTSYLKSEALGREACLAGNCRAPIHLTFPEDVEGPLRIPESAPT